MPVILNFHYVRRDFLVNPAILKLYIKTETEMPKQKTKSSKKRKPVKKWSARVTATSDALDLRQNIFTSDDATTIAKALKKSALRSHRRKGTPYQSAMSMLNFYINRAGKNLPEQQQIVLEDAKDKLRVVFGRE